jgi:hypothetical protein
MLLLLLSSSFLSAIYSYSYLHFSANSRFFLIVRQQSTILISQVDHEDCHPKQRLIYFVAVVVALLLLLFATTIFCYRLIDYIFGVVEVEVR